MAKSTNPHIPPFFDFFISIEALISLFPFRYGYQEVTSEQSGALAEELVKALVEYIRREEDTSSIYDFTATNGEVTPTASVPPTHTLDRETRREKLIM